MFSLEHYEKPLHSISNYKSLELEDIAEKLNLPTWNKENDKKYKKNELYENIIRYLI